MGELGTFVFRKHAHIGAAAAEEDATYLDECFVDTGDLGILCDLSEARRFVLGRTGSGKTALLAELERAEERVIRIAPEKLALSHITNSQILRFLMRNQVKLDVFFRLLWRHVFVVEILRHYYHIYSKREKESFLTRILSLIGNDPEKKAALRYLEEWGEDFWKETDKRTIETTKRLETELGGAIGSAFPGMKLDGVMRRDLTEEERAEVRNRAQDVVNRVQIRELSDMMDFLAEDVLADPQKKYFIVIDRLDEDWIEDKLRYRLIRALIETARDFQKVPNAKIVVALRRDLLDRVLRVTRDAGFQEEKYRSLCLDVNWTRSELIQVVDRRINRLVKEQYTSREVQHSDILVQYIGSSRERAIDYMLDRTFRTPRDIICFFNTCLGRAVGKPRITEDVLLDAELEYSERKLKSLADEWYADYPNLLEFAAILEGCASQFELGELDVRDFCLNFIVSEQHPNGPLYEISRRLVETEVTPEQARDDIVGVFYGVGLIGLESPRTGRVVWSYEQGVQKGKEELREDMQVCVHPAFYRCLGIQDT